jgi:hypothetical protein
MQLEKKAIYNLLRLNYLDDPTILVEDWQIENLRSFSDDEIIEKINRFNLLFEKEKFLAYCEGFDSPEELANNLLSDISDEKTKDKLYLLFFELWRRWLNHKQSISIFCDELDNLIFLYQKNKLENDELIQDFLAVVLNILNANVDRGENPKELFATMSKYLAHNLESFLYEYISSQIDVNNQSYATELIEGFYPYISNENYFEFLKVRLISKIDIASANEIVSKIIKKLSQKMDLSLSISILIFLVEVGDPDLFIKLLKFVIPYIKKEEEFSFLAKLVADYYRRLDKEELERQVLDVLNQRIGKDPKNDLEKKRSWS